MATPCPGVSDEQKAPQGTVSGGCGAVGGTAAGLTEHLELEKSGLLAAYTCHPGRSKGIVSSLLGLGPHGTGQTCLARRASAAHIGCTGPRSVCWRLGPQPVPGDSPALS